MTNDYKDKLLKYLSGNVNNGMPTNTPYITETKVAPVSSDNNTYGDRFVYCTDSNGEPNGKTITYGLNFISLYDENGTLLKKFTKFESGTNIGFIQYLDVDEKGNVYAIEGLYITDSRIILLNNISEKGTNADYKCILRTSYFIRTTLDMNTYQYAQCVGLTKSRESANYMVYWSGQLVNNNIYVLGTQLTINVGSANDWVDYSPTIITTGGLSSSSIQNMSYYDTNDNIQVKIYVFFYSNPNITINKVINSDTTLSNSVYLTKNINAGVNGVSINALFVNENKLYINTIGQSLNGNNLTYKTRLFLIDNGSLETLISYDDVVPGDSYVIILGTMNWLTQIGDLLFYTYQRPHNNSDDRFDTYYGVIPNTTSYDFNFTLGDQTLSIGFMVSKVYNIYSLIVLYTTSNLQTYKEVTKIIYNPNNYNGTEYENKNSLLPKQGILFDENNNLIFARNLYNYKVYNNRSISVLNIPNTYLNDVEIGNQKLLSDTNTTIIDDMEPINKNIYEDLYINFNNQLIMQNQNDTNYVDNLEGAIRLNQSTGSVLDYDNAKANKIRVTYDDDTSYITMANNEINNDICTYTIGVHVPSNKNILKIDIISNDENTIYQSITNLNLANDKYYVITQDVHVV